jgi:hypothetical protein
MRLGVGGRPRNPGNRRMRGLRRWETATAAAAAAAAAAARGAEEGRKHESGGSGN